MPVSPKDFEQFARDYRKEERELLVLTSDAPGGAGKGRGDEVWMASRYFLAYVDTGTNETFKGDGRLVWPLTEEDRQAHGSSFPYFFKDACIYRIKGREPIDKTPAEGMLPSFYNRFLVVEAVEENAGNDALLAILEEYRRPVVIADELLGEFVLDKDHSTFEGRIAWLENTVQTYLDVDADDKDTWAKALEALRALCEQQAQKDAEFRAFAAKNLVELANDWRQEEDDDDAETETPITEEDFADRIALSSLSLDADGGFTAWYDDDDMFLGHVVAVSGHVRTGPESAEIEG